jgi:hypothetical protein
MPPAAALTFGQRGDGAPPQVRRSGDSLTRGPAQCAGQHKGHAARQAVFKRCQAALLFEGAGTT